MENWKLIKKDLIKKVKGIKCDDDLKEFVDLFYKGFMELEKINEISYVG